jgi:uncharacterized damage-inducible protein DinB
MTATHRARPADSEYAPWYAGYVSAVPDGDILDLLRANGEEISTLLSTVTEAKGGHRYAEGKWTVRDLLGHVIDAERIFAYRALRIARGDATPLASFEQNDYVRAANADARPVASLARELVAVRASSVLLLESLPDEAWGCVGMASDKAVTVRALAYIILGHARHHIGVLREKYGIA